jgi:hypothetical protein
MAMVLGQASGGGAVDVAQALRLKHQLEQQQWNSKYQQSRKPGELTVLPPPPPPPPHRGAVSHELEKHSHVEILKAQLHSVSKENEEYRRLTSHLKQSLEVNARLDAEKRLEQAKSHNEQYANLTKVLSQHLNVPGREAPSARAVPQVASLPKAITDRIDRAITNGGNSAASQNKTVLGSGPQASEAMMVTQPQSLVQQPQSQPQSQPQPPTLRSTRNTNGSGGSASARLEMWRSQKARQAGTTGANLDYGSATTTTTRARAERLGRQVAGEQAEIYLQRLAVQEAQTLLKEVQMQRMESQHEQLQV